MKRLGLLSLILCFLFLSQVTHVLAIEQNSSREVEKVEVKNGMKIIYYSDGAREFFIACSANINVQTSVSTVVSRAVHYTPPNWPNIIEKIFKVINQILKTLAKVGVGSFLLAWRIWNLIKSLRKGRPRDYYGAGLNYS